MKKIIIYSGISLVLIVGLFLLTGCGEEKSATSQNTSSTPTPTKVAVQPNTTMGYIKIYVPSDFTYRPDLRGLIYTENQRKLFVKGDPNDRSTAVIIDITAEEFNTHRDVYINKKNENIKDGNTYKLKSEKPVLYFRDKFEGKSGNTVIYNYSYIVLYENTAYNIIVSGPSTAETELLKLKDDIKASLKVGV